MNKKFLNPNPFTQFARWYEKRDIPVKGEDSTMILATADKGEGVMARAVLLKSYDERGFVFYTNYHSRKGLQIKENPQGALLFLWGEQGRQIRIEGKIEKTTPEESDRYFYTRPYKSRLGAHASFQSRIVDSRMKLIWKVIRLMGKYPTFVPRPEYWGGYRLIPDLFEFWNEGPYRLHDRFEYILTDDGWQIERLYP